MSQRAWSTEQVRALGPTTDAVPAGSVLGFGRTTAYRLARDGQFPIPSVVGPIERERLPMSECRAGAQRMPKRGDAAPTDTGKPDPEEDSDDQFG